MKQRFTDEQIVQYIKGSKQEREAVFAYMYQDANIRRIIISNVKSKGGNAADGADVFQESLIILDRHIREKGIDLKYTIKAYLIGIGRWYWFGIQRKQKKLPFMISEDMLLQEIPDNQTVNIQDVLEEEQLNTLIDDLIARLGADCQTALKYRQLNYALKEIAQLMGLEYLTAKSKFEYCRSKLREAITKNIANSPNLYNFFLKYT